MIKLNKPEWPRQDMNIHSSIDSLDKDAKAVLNLQSKFLKHYNAQNIWMTNSCTSALNLIALTLELNPEDEIIVPSYTFVSTAAVWLQKGVKIKFVDSQKDHPNMDIDHLKSLITDNTKVIVVMHYGGMACDMESILALAAEHQITIIEDAAQCIDAYHIKNGEKTPLGALGNWATLSFHQTKNIHCGEGGFLLANHEDPYNDDIDAIFRHGTNKKQFINKEVDLYEWTAPYAMNVGMNHWAATFLNLLWEERATIRQQRMAIWDDYYLKLKDWSIKHQVTLPIIEEYMAHNAHVFYMVMPSKKHQQDFIKHMDEKRIQCVSHFFPLHLSKQGKSINNQALPNAEKMGNQLVRIPLHTSLSEEDREYIIEQILNFSF